MITFQPAPQASRDEMGAASAADSIYWTDFADAEILGAPLASGL